MTVVIIPFRADRIGRPGGGVIIYVRQSLVCKLRRTDLEINNLEAVWLKICVRSKEIWIGGFYRPPNSTADYFTILSESIDRAYNTNIPDIVIAGNFNFNMRTNGNNKIKDLIQNYNLEQLINEDTHFFVSWIVAYCFQVTVTLTSCLSSRKIKIRAYLLY